MEDDLIKKGDELDNANLTQEELVELAAEQFTDLLWETWLAEQKRKAKVSKSRQVEEFLKTGNNL